MKEWLEKHDITQVVVRHTHDDFPDYWSDAVYEKRGNGWVSYYRNSDGSVSSPLDCDDYDDYIMLKALGEQIRNINDPEINSWYYDDQYEYAMYDINGQIVESSIHFEER